MEQMRQKLLLVIACLVCAVIGERSFLALEGREFGGGSLASNKDLGSLLFPLALILAFKFPRSAALTGLTACLVSLPFYLYLVFPHPFREVWPGYWKVFEPPRKYFVWDGWWITGIVFNILVACISISRLVRSLPSRGSAQVGR
jgi:hypothetical protein